MEKQKNTKPLLVADTTIRPSMKLLSISIVLIFVGVVLVVTPDHGPVLIRFNARLVPDDPESLAKSQIRQKSDGRIFI